jgi:hypothetical protein
MVRADAGVKRNGRWITTQAKLRDHWPEALDEVLYDQRCDDD